MNLKFLAIAALAAPLLAVPAVAAEVSAVPHFSGVQLLQVDDDDSDSHHGDDDDSHRHRDHDIDAGQASRIARNQGFEVQSVRHGDDVFRLVGRRHGQLFNITISEEGRILSISPVHRHHDEDDEDED